MATVLLLLDVVVDRLRGDPSDEPPA
jgi:hypothetical protein